MGARPATIHWIVRVVTPAHWIVFLVVGLRSVGPWSARRFVEVSALGMCTFLLCAPIVHRAHFPWILPAFTLLLSIAGSAAARAERTLARVALVLSACLIGLTSSGIVCEELSRWLTGHKVVTIGSQVTWIALVILLHRRFDHPPCNVNAPSSNVA